MGSILKSDDIVDYLVPARALAQQGSSAYLSGRRIRVFVLALLLISAVKQIGRILPFVLAESTKTDLGLSDIQLGRFTGMAFSVAVNGSQDGFKPIAN